MTTTVVDRFLDTITSSGFAAATGLCADDAHLDASVPGWRFTGEGRAAICAAYSRWFNEPGTFEELRRLPLPAGKMVE